LILAGDELAVDDDLGSVRLEVKYANISIFDVGSPAELHEILNSLPLYPLMEVEVTALCHHPGSLEPPQ
jgi:muconolactone D-isomerase